MVIQEPERQSSYLALVWSQARWITFGSSRLETALYKKTSVQCLVYSLDPFVKDYIVWYAQVHNTHLFKFHVLVFGFWFNRSWFS